MAVVETPKFTVTAPGKVILHGEHSVVYGKTALAASVNLRTTAKVYECEDLVCVNFPKASVSENWLLKDIRDALHDIVKEERVSYSNPGPVSDNKLNKIRQFLAAHAKYKQNDSVQEMALVSFLHLYTSILSDLPPLRIDVDTNLPIGAGLGSSASFSVCLAAALLRCNSNTVMNGSSEEGLKLVSRWAFASEQGIHGSPSGIDNSVCTFGSVLAFRSGQINILPHAARLRILLVNTRVPRNTKSLVAKVRDRKERIPAVVLPIIDSMDAVAVTAKNVLENLGASGETDIEHFKTLEELIDINHNLLASLGVSHPALEKVVSIAARYNLHGKLTGAGGGGFAFVLLPPAALPESIDALRSELIGEGLECWDTELGGPGLSYETF